MTSGSIHFTTHVQYSVIEWVNAKVSLSSKTAQDISIRINSIPNELPLTDNSNFIFL